MMALSDFKLPKYGVLMNYSWYLAAKHILRVNYAEMAGDTEAIC